MRCDAKGRVSETFGGKKTKQNKTRKRTTKGGPHGHVHRARNFISESGRPCFFHAFLNLHDAIPMESQAIYSLQSGEEEKTTTREYEAPHLIGHAY